MEMQKLAAEAFLQSYCNTSVAYQAMNSGSKTLVDPQELVEAYEHNYKATLGREADGATRPRVRQVAETTARVLVYEFMAH